MYCDLLVCMSVCLFATCPNLTKFPVNVTCGRGLVVLWQQCNKLCTSSFVEWMVLFFCKKRVALVISTWAPRCSKVELVINLPRIRQGAPHCLTVIVYNGSKLAPGGGEVCCLRLPCRWVDLLTVWQWKAAGALQAWRPWISTSSGTVHVGRLNQSTRGACCRKETALSCRSNADRQCHQGLFFVSWHWIKNSRQMHCVQKIKPFVSLHIFCENN